MAGWQGKDPKEWATECKELMEKVYKISAQKMGDRLTQTVFNGGRVPHKTGNLYRSLLASTSAMPKTSKGPFPGQDIGIVIAQLDVTKPLYFGYQAEYARRMNFGFKGEDSLGRVYNFSGFGFVEDAINMWPTFVAEAIKEAGG